MQSEVQCYYKICQSVNSHEIITDYIMYSMYLNYGLRNAKPYTESTYSYIPIVTVFVLF